MGTYAVDTAEAPKVIQALETQHALRANIGQLEAGLTITDGGKEQTVASERIDILAEDTKKRAVVIELKVGKAERDAIGQILSYMGGLRRPCAGSWWLATFRRPRSRRPGPHRISVC